MDKRVNVTNRIYTWSNLREDPSLAKLDRIFVSDYWDDCFGLARVTSVLRPISDHMPICPNSSERTRRKKWIFYFEKWWLEPGEL